MKTGDLADAKSAFERGLAIRQALLQADPSDADDQFFVTGLLRRIGDLARKQGDLKTARQDYEQCMAIRQRLSRSEPLVRAVPSRTGTRLLRYRRLAFEQNDQETAKADYEQSLAILRRLTAADPTNAELQQQVLLDMVRYARMSSASVTWGRGWGAVQCHEEGRAFWRRRTISCPRSCDGTASCSGIETASFTAGGPTTDRLKPLGGRVRAMSD